QPQAIPAGPDGNLYFTEPPINMIVQITPNGVFTDVQAIKPAGSPWGIAVDAARNLWMTQLDGNKISRLPIPEHAGHRQPSVVRRRPVFDMSLYRGLQKHQWATPGLQCLV